MNAYLKQLSDALQQKIKKKKIPLFEKPMLATLTKDYFDDKNWIFERKFDGERCLIIKDGNSVTLKSRNNKPLNDTYPELVEATKKLAVKSVILDGEVVAFEGKRTSFQKLQQRLGISNAQEAKKKNIKIYIYIFDLLYIDGYQITDLPLESRKAILKANIQFEDPLRYTIHKNEIGKEYFKQACHKHWEGLIAKKRNSKYVHIRSKNWLKFKCVANQELVIGGYTEPENSRHGFGALLLGYYKGTKLHYAGKVGTGFSDDFLKEFSKALEKITIQKNPFTSKNVERKDVHFVEPHYVAEIGFEEWTKDNKLRQARFLGLRTDKSAKDVVQEKAK